MIPPVDLTTCDVEPIHLIGAIQPFGVLVCADRSNFRITRVSENAQGLLGWHAPKLLGMPLASVIGAANLSDLLDRPLQPTMPDLIRPWFLSVAQQDGAVRDLECYAHLQGEEVVLEFVEREAMPAPVWDEDRLRQRITAELIRPQELEALAETGAAIIREVTGFDRVMIYRFAADRHGEVIAESTDRPDRFMGLHYPASDIPDPARRHFSANVIRAIPDIAAAPVPVLGRGDAFKAQPLDLTHSKLRAVAPVHVQYLANMGVAASMSISLTAHDGLWGLIACHHYSPRRIAWSRMRFCELVGAILSTLLQSLENTAKLRKTVMAEKAAFAIEQQAGAAGGLADVLLPNLGELLELAGAQGLVARIGGRLVNGGTTGGGAVDPAGLARLMDEGIVALDELPPGMDAGGTVAGVAILALSDDGEDWLQFHRAPFEETISWAGKPEKQTVRDGEGRLRLSPRGSFEVWREERRGHSRPFSAGDREFLRILRRALYALISIERERAALAAQRQAQAEEAHMRRMLLDAARSRSLGELAGAFAHELNQPLAAVTNYVNACRQELRNFGMPVPAPLERLMASAVAESSRAADLVRRLRSFIGDGEISPEPLELHTFIRQTIKLAMDGYDHQPDIAFDLDPNVGIVAADPVQLGQVVLNLVRNSQRAMADVPLRRLTVTTRGLGHEIEVRIVDTGEGIATAIRPTLFEPFHTTAADGMGLGLALSRSIVQAHGGRIWSPETATGAEFRFTLKAGGRHG